MKRIILGATCLSLLLPISAQANEFVFGAKTGLYDIDRSSLDSAWMLSGQVSYEFLDLQMVDLAAEFELGTTITDGDATLNVPTAQGSNAEYSAMTIGAYISARTAGPIYAIARAGVVKTDVEVKASAPNLASIKQSNDETGIAIGAGVGFSLGVRTEVELTRYSIDDEQAFYLSAGVAF